MTRSRSRRSRGAATVEMAITMLLVVPIFLYALFLDDLLRYRQSQQEAILSTLWDFTTQNYDRELDKGGAKRDPGSNTLVQKNARYMFCDHESGYDRFDKPDGDTYLDCTSEDHHKKGAVVAHECWLNNAAQQIMCVGPDDSVGASSNNLWKQVQSAEHSHGGMLTCTGNLVVENYLLPRTFMQEFSKDDKGVQLSKANWSGAGGSYHGNAEAGTQGTGDNGTAYFFEKDKFSLLVDPWAYNKDQNVKPGEKSGSPDSASAFWQDTDTVFRKNLLYAGYMAAADTFLVQLGTQQLLNPAFLPPMNVMGGDDPTKPNLSITSNKAPSIGIPQESGKSTYFSSPWKDGSDVYEKTYNARGDHYMGCQDSEQC